jgi:hypothetical protein
MVLMIAILVNLRYANKYIFKMKLLYTLILGSSIAISCKAQNHQLIKIWESDSLAVPESVLPSLKEHILYTSLINGHSSAIDGNGSIAKVSMKGKILDPVWVKGLNAPKGLGRFQNKLYVADLTEVVVIDIPAKKIIAKIPAEGSMFLNDIAVDAKGIVYVSETRKGKIYRIVNKKAEVWLENIENANGLKVIGNDLYILSGAKLIKANPKKEITTVAEGFAKPGDGVESLSNGDFIVSCWNGLIYYVYKNGKIELLIDTQAKKINTADIGIDPVKNIIYVPTFNKKSIIAFQLK